MHYVCHLLPICVDSCNTPTTGIQCVIGIKWIDKNIPHLSAEYISRISGCSERSRRGAFVAFLLPLWLFLPLCFTLYRFICNCCRNVQLALNRLWGRFSGCKALWLIANCTVCMGVCGCVWPGMILGRRSSSSRSYSSS